MKQKRYVIVLTLILVMQVVWIIYWGNVKEGYHTDEIYSYGLSNSYYSPFVSSDGDFWNEWHNKDWLLRYVAVSEDHRFAYDSVYYNQTQDVHPFLYYAILHTVCSFFPGVFSKWFAIGVSTVFAVLTLIVLYNLSKKLLRGGKTEALILCAAYALSAGTISHVMFLRMYVMLAFFTMLYTYLHVLLYEGKKVYIPIILCVIMGGLTQYFFYVFAFFISAFYCLYKLYLKQYKQLMVYVVVMFASIGINIAIFPSTLTHIFFGYRGQEAFENLQNESIISKVTAYIPYVNMEIFGGLIRYIIAILALVIFLMFVIKCVRLEKKPDMGIVMHISLKNDRVITQKIYIIISLLFTTVAYMVLISTISSLIGSRYIFCIYPFILMAFFILLDFLMGIMRFNGIRYSVLLLCVCTIITVAEYKRGYVDFLYQGYEAIADDIAVYGDLDVVYVTDYDFSIYRDMMFLARSNRFIDLHYTDFENDLEEVYTQKNEEGILCYVYKEHEPQEVLDILEERLGYTQITQIAETYQSMVYLCQ